MFGVNISRVKRNVHEEILNFTFQGDIRLKISSQEGQPFKGRRIPGYLIIYLRRFKRTIKF